MKLHKNDLSNKRLEIFSSGVIDLPLPWGYILVLNHEKNLQKKSKFKSVFLKLVANDQSDNSFL